MRYILQLSTGSFSGPACRAQDAERMLEYCMEALDVEKVIFGWAADNELNREISGMLDRYPVEKYLWLPVFAEIHSGEAVRQGVELTEEKQKTLHTCKEDAFDFVCQSSRESLDGAVEVFEKLTEGCRMDGVFLDRIRYASGAGGVGALYGCWCPACQALYEESGVDTERIKYLAKRASMTQFMPGKLGQGIYRYEDEDIDRLMEAKRKNITDQVGRLGKRFHERGLKVGADTFAPVISDFVGQDIFALARVVDFVKPMVYVRTDAPAGLPFELRALGGEVKERLDELWGGDTGSMELAVEQIRELKGAGGVIAPGIDANYVEDICSADAAYVKEYLSRLAAAGAESVVLSWDIMRISRETIDAVRAVNLAELLAG